MQEQDRPAAPGNQEGEDGAVGAEAAQTGMNQAGKDAPAPEIMPSTEELLKQAELAAQEHHDAWLRAKAETENVRKRAQVDIANAHKFALESFAQELLPVKDSLEAALASTNLTLDSLRSGVELTLKQLSGDSHGL